MLIFLIAITMAVFMCGCNSTWNFCWKSVVTSPSLESQGEITLETHQDDADVTAETSIPVDVE